MKKHNPSTFWNLFMAAALAVSMLFSKLGGVTRVEASSDPTEFTVAMNHAASAPETVTYNDTDKAWSYSGKWETKRFRNAYRGQAHISTAIGDYATISVSGSKFTLLYGVHKKYGKLDVYIDDVKIQTIDQNNPRQLQKKEWKSPDLGAGTHLVKFVHASGEMVSIDAIKITILSAESAPSSNSASITSPTPTSIATLEPNPTVPPTSTEIPTLAVIPSATASLPPTEIPTLTVLPSPTATLVPFSLPTLQPDPTLTTSPVPTVQSATATISPTPSQLPPPSTSPTLTATSLSAQSATPVSGTIYYVSGGIGSDANPGTQALPWKTIQKCLNTVKAGDTCLVAAGTYNEALVLKTKGTNSAPISLVCQTPKGCTVSSGNNRTLVTSGNINYYTIDGFRLISSLVDNSHPMATGTVNFSYNFWGDGEKAERGNDGFVLRNCYIEGAIYIFGSNNVVENCEINGRGLIQNVLTIAYAPSDDNIVRNNIFHDSTLRGVWVLQYGKNNLIEDNTFYNFGSGMGVDCDGAGSAVYGCNIKNNLFYNARSAESAIHLENSFDSVVEGNVIHDVGTGLDIVNYNIENGDGFHSDKDYKGLMTNTIIRNNLMYNLSRKALRCAAVRGNQFVNNTIHNVPSNALAFERYTGVFCPDWIVKNNIVSQSPSTVFWDNQAQIIMDDNFYNGSFGVFDYGASRTLSFSQWQARGYDLNSLFGNPLFVNPAAGDFRLQSNSPACTAGENRTHVGAFPCQ